MSSYRKLILFSLLLLIIGGGLAIWNADRKMKREAAIRKEQAAKQNSPSMVGRNASFIVTEGKVKKWKLDAATATYSENNSQADLSQVKGEFYDAAGKPVLKFSAPKGTYTTKNNAVTLSGGVIAESTQQVGQGGKGGKLIAPRMVWSAKTDQVTASGGVELTFPEGKSTAQTCRFTLDFSNIFLEGGVTSALSP